jgi:hypothetical protein
MIWTLLLLWLCCSGLLRGRPLKLSPRLPVAKKPEVRVSNSWFHADIRQTEAWGASAVCTRDDCLMWDNIAFSGWALTCGEGKVQKMMTL